MREKFQDINFRAASLELIGKINDILREYAARRYTLSLRQLYYQLVSRNIVPNTERSYKNVGNLVSDGRLAGLIDWAMIEDRGRDTDAPPRWDSPSQFVSYALSHWFGIDTWQDQPNHVEVLVEKAALEGILQPICLSEGINFTSNRGYASSTLMRDIGARLRRKRIQNGKQVHVIYLGDHDPSGIDMTRDIQERLDMFSRGPVQVHRIALNMNQVEEWQPPENPAKTTDSRFQSYIAEYGESSWELDAVSPERLVALVTATIIDLRDDDLYQAQLARQERMKTSLQEFADNYEDEEER